MANDAFLLDLGKCIGCNACVVACKTGNELPLATQYIHIGEMTVGSYPDVQSRITNKRCYHCQEAACVAVCPTGALYKENGMTRVDDSICSACQYCLTACPFAIPKLVDGHIHKCDGCADVVRAGGTPWCVKTCPSNALMYGERTEILAEAQKRLGTLQKRYPQARIYGETEAGGLNVIMVMPDNPEMFDLPAAPRVGDLTTLWQSVAQPAGLALTSMSIVVTGLAAVIARRNHMREKQMISGAAVVVPAEPPPVAVEEQVPDERILRYRPGQRLVHATLAISFLMLLFTGLGILWEPLTVLDAGPISRFVHRLGAIGFLLVPLLYLVIDRRGAIELIVESFTYDRDDWEWLKKSPRYFFGRATGMPPQGRLNAGQKIHHAGVIIMSFFVVATGLTMWLGPGRLAQELMAATVIVHDVSMLVLTVLLAGHLYFTFVYKALSGMTSGYVDREAAELEHAKWVEEIDRRAK